MTKRELTKALSQIANDDCEIVVATHKGTLDSNNLLDTHDIETTTFEDANEHGVGFLNIII